MTEGIILNRINYEETSYILYVLTSDGYYSLISRGAKRKNSEKLALSEPINLINFEKTKSSSMPTLTEGVIINDFFKIKNDLEKFTIASLMVEFLYQAKDSIIDTFEAYNLLKISLNDLENDKKNNELLLFQFEMVMLKLLGSSINIEYLKEEYKASIELIEALKKILNNDLSFDKSVVRNFFKEYILKECSINLKSYKLYLSLMNEEN